MSGLIPQAFIDDLISRIDIVDLIDSRVPLRRAGRDYKACCPFHDEKSPSFTVSPEKQFFHCFGCGAHGTAIGFLMAYEQLDFREAVKELAESAGVELPQAEASTRDPSEARGHDLVPLLQQATHYYAQQLRHHPEAPRAVAYLQQRGLSGEIARDFTLGYAPPGFDNLRRALSNYSEAALLEAGLLTGGEKGRPYDRFRDRVMFPIHDRRGRVVGFGGRTLESDKAHGPKYLNSPETPLFHKGSELYGLYLARQATRQPPRLLVVEGYMDVVALAQFGIRYAVATLGTAFTANHLSQLLRVSSEVIFCFDGDRAGREAAWRSLQQIIPQAQAGRQFRFMFLPDGEDPDTLVRRIGSERFAAAAAAAPGLADFIVDQLSRQHNLKQFEGRMALLNDVRPLLSQLPAGIYRQQLTDHIASRSQINPQQLLSDSASGRVVKTAVPTPRRRQPAPTTVNSPLRHAMTLLLQRPALAREAVTEQQLAQLQTGITLPGLPLLLQMIELLQHDPNLNSAAPLLEHWRGQSEANYLSQLMMREPLLAEPEAQQREFSDTLVRLINEQRLLRREALLQKPLPQLTDAERRELQQL